jgi:hypothetical protein
MPAKEKVIVENVNVPGYSSRVDGEKYEAMRKVLLKVVPKSPQGITQRELFEDVYGHPGRRFAARPSKLLHRLVHARLEIIKHTIGSAHLRNRRQRRCAQNSIMTQSVGQRTQIGVLDRCPRGVAEP